MVPYLLGRGLLTAADVVDREVTVAEVSRRNRSFRVSRRGGGGLFLKQAGAEAGDEALHAEAAFLETCTRDGPLAALRPLVPRFMGFDPYSQSFVTELLDPAVHLWRLLERSPDGAEPAARLLGSALALVHRTPRARAVEELALGLGAPWVLAIDRPGLEALPALSPANQALLRIVQGEDALMANLGRLQRDFRPSALIHGDVKGDNVLVAEGALPGDGALHLVDWELVQFGDPAWDLGGALHDFLVHWIGSIPLSVEREVGEQLARADQPLARLRPALRALWDGYRREAGLEGAGALAFLLASVRYCGARLLQAAWERGALAAELSNAAIAMVQLGANLLAHPQPACFGLLGIPLPALGRPHGVPASAAPGIAAEPGSGVEP